MSAKRETQHCATMNIKNILQRLPSIKQYTKNIFGVNISLAKLLRMIKMKFNKSLAFILSLLFSQQTAFAQDDVKCLVAEQFKNIQVVNASQSVNGSWIFESAPFVANGVNWIVIFGLYNSFGKLPDAQARWDRAIISDSASSYPDYHGECSYMDRWWELGWITARIIK